jgi:hypothetical protein
VSDRPVYRLTLEAEPSEIPAARRLARLLKALKRAYGFACIKAEELPDQAGAESKSHAEQHRE